VPRADYDKALADAGRALDWLRGQRGSLELLGIPSRKDDLKDAAKLAAGVKGMKTVAVLGIGGSSLGGQALTALRRKTSPWVEFHDNPDPFSWDVALKRFDLQKDAFHRHFEIRRHRRDLDAGADRHRGFDQGRREIAQEAFHHHHRAQERSALADFADSIGAPKLAHPEGVGGRYSVLTVVGVLPAILMGIDVKKLRGGAQAILDATLSANNPADAPAAMGAALHQALAAEGKLATTILWPYADKLKVFGGWWRQLWAESLGKDGKGSTPVSVLGSGGPAQPTATVPRRAGQRPCSLW